eukprot:768504-Hanusia_phi.AAC.1
MLAAPWQQRLHAEEIRLGNHDAGLGRLQADPLKLEGLVVHVEVAEGSEGEGWRAVVEGQDTGSVSHPLHGHASVARMVEDNIARMPLLCHSDRRVPLCWQARPRVSAECR